MDRPQPQRITVDSVPCRIRLLILWFGDQAARDWLQHEAPAYGKFVQAGTREYVLIVDGKYDLADVAAYLRSGNTAALLEG